MATILVGDARANEQGVRGEVILSDFSAHAVKDAWQILDYETLDGIKGRLLYSPWGFRKRVKAEIPLPVKGKYRIFLGVAGTRYALTEAPFCVMVRLKRDPAPVLMDAQAPVKEAGWWFQPVENEWKAAELDGDTLVVESPRNSRSLLAWIRLVSVDVLPDCSHPVHEMIVTDDAYHYCASEDDGLDEVLAPIMRYANSPVKKLFFCVAHGDSVYAVPTAVGQSHEGLSDDDVESLHARDCNRVYRRLRRRHSDLLSRLADFTHSQGMEFHVSFRTGCTLDITHLTHPASEVDPGRDAVGVSRAENYCRLWDGTPVARYSYAKREVQDHFLSLYREMLTDSWREVELMHRLTDVDGSEARRWEAENPVSSRVHPFKIFMGFDAAHYPWHMAY